MGVDLRQLRALLAVVDKGTFTDAAIALHTTQASVSRAVAALERSLGTTVLLRSTRSATLTPVGEQVVEHAREALRAVQAIDQLTASQSRDLRIGYAWSALGEHTANVQRQWAQTHPGRTLTFVSCNTVSAGLVEGVAEVAVLRRPLPDTRFSTVQVGIEHRYAVLARTDVLSRRRRLRLADFRGRVLARNAQTGTTGEHLWAGREGPAAYRDVGGAEDFLTCIAAGQAVGITSTATRHQHPRPDVVYRPVVDAPPVPVLFAWWRTRPGADVEQLITLLQAAYAAAPSARH